jgi:hypothetical protein
MVAKNEGNRFGCRQVKRTAIARPSTCQVERTTGPRWGAIGNRLKMPPTEAALFQ